MTKLQLKFLQDLKSCPAHNEGDWYDKLEAHKHFLSLGWKDKSFKAVLGSLYKKKILHPELGMFYIWERKNVSKT
tara:strand:+ start:177 stop:401 length:225 start_codon:yes stop_codon:yes gene_type:complete